jgi:hypothetical protein
MCETGPGQQAAQTHDSYVIMMMMMMMMMAVALLQVETYS